jgi:glycosyltransferase involved in cell wall biosynthesis
MLSTDRNICRPESLAAQRMVKYGAHPQATAFDIIVVSTRTHGLTKVSLSDKVTVYPTDSKWWPLYVWDIIRIARTLPRPDIVTTQDPFEMGSMGWIVSCMFGVPLYVQIHTDFISSGYSEGSLVRRVRQVMARFVLSRATRVRVVLTRIADFLKRRRLRAPISVLPVYVDIARYASVVRNVRGRSRYVLLVASRLESEKRVSCAISTLKAAREAGHDACLCIVGDGSLRANLETYARSHKIEKFVDFQGWQDDVRPYLATASLVLVPSAYEGYGMTIVEALAAGVPVLSTDVGIAREAGAIIANRADFPQALINAQRVSVCKLR